jgi:hypothetical protein
MAAITPTTVTASGYKGPIRTYGTSAANQADTLTTDVQTFTQKLSYAYVSYSAAPTETGVIFEIDSSLGAGYDVRLSVAAANTQFNPYIPANDVYILPGDAVRVTSAAAGGVITGAVVIVTEPA